jgi:CRP/FNR family transcriptional regulator, cyclic AMP receptor protein
MDPDHLRTLPFFSSLSDKALDTADVIKAGEIIASLGPGDVFGEMAILSGRERTADVVATSSTRLITLRKSHLKPISNEVSEQLQALVDERLGRQD